MSSVLHAGVTRDVGSCLRRRPARPGRHCYCYRQETWRFVPDPRGLGRRPYPSERRRPKTQRGAATLVEAAIWVLGAAQQPGRLAGHDGPDNRRRFCLDPAHVGGLVVLRHESGAVVHSHRADAQVSSRSLVGRVFRPLMDNVFQARRCS